MKELIDFFISHRSEVWEQTKEHLYLTVLAMTIATLLGVALGVLLTRNKRLVPSTLGIVGVIQTIPSLALLGFLLPILGIGTAPAIVALFLYALLPIVRNTYTGISEIDPSIKEAAVGMGMTSTQLLRYVELPIAFPVILAGIRTATVINVGIATLCALIAAGGLGEFIFRGVTLNNVNMILAGAIPASLLAITIDAYLGFILLNIKNRKLVIGTISVPAILIFFSLLIGISDNQPKSKIIAGFNSEFVEREDGYPGLSKAYNMQLDIKEMDIGLLYQALDNGDVDLIEGFSTDGKIQAYDFTRLSDDKQYFPPYYCATLINNKALERFPQLESALNRLEGKISDELMASINYQVDEEQQSLKEAASDLLEKALDIRTDVEAGLSPEGEIIIGSKTFTESYILAHVFAQLIEYETGIKTSLKLGFGGTKLLFDALKYDEVHLYPEYTGTGFLVILNPPNETITKLISNKDSVYNYVQREFQREYGISWLKPLGFNNTYAMLMRKKQANDLQLKTISDLADYLNQ